MTTKHESLEWKSKLHGRVHLFAICLFLFSLAFSRFLLTLSLILLALNWLLEANFKERFVLFFKDKPAVIFTSIFGLSLVGVLWAENTLDAFLALQHKLPTLLLPIIIVTSKPLNTRDLKLVLLVLFGSVVAVSLIGVGLMMFNSALSNYREALPFVPVTSFSMIIVITIFSVPILFQRLKTKPWLFYLGLGVSLWLVVYLIILRSLTGIASLAAAIAFTILFSFIKSFNKWINWGLALLFFALIGGGATAFSYMYKITHVEVPVDINSLPETTAHGHKYSHWPNQKLRENGHLVYICISDEELEAQWSQHSSMDYEGFDKSGEQLKYTLYRYMASKGLTKDWDGFNELTLEDIENVEDGFTNYLYPTWPGILRRFHTLTMGLYIYETSDAQHPEWSTLTQRIELWKASYLAFKEKPVLGWGTGNAELAVDFGLKQMDSSMMNFSKRSHNQYLTLLLLWGIVGTLAFIFLYSLFVVKSGGYRYFIFNLFIVIVLVNGLANDPVENQIGQNFIVFFSIFFHHYFAKPKANLSSLFNH